MRLLLLSAYFPPDIGSAAHLFDELGQALVARGHQVSVITGFPSYYAQGDLARYRGRAWLRETIGGMEVYRIRVPSLARHTPLGRGLWQFSCALSLTVAGLSVPCADVTLLYSPPLPLGLTALTWRIMRGVPFVLNVQDLFPQSAIDLGLMRQKPLIRFFKALERFIYQRADAITVHSEGNRAHVRACGGSAQLTRVIHNSVDIGYVKPSADAHADRRAFGLDGQFVVSFAGVMGYSQDLDVILDAAHLLRDEPQVHFLLVGDGVEKERLVKKSEAMRLSNVMWLPMQPREQYPKVLQASDVGLATLRAEVKTPVVPSKILHIMAAGVPVVAALDAQSDARRLIEDSQAGCWLPPESPQDLAETIARLYRDRDLARGMGANGRCYAEQHMALPKIAEQYELLFQEVIASRLLTAKARSARSF